MILFSGLQEIPSDFVLRNLLVVLPRVLRGSDGGQVREQAGWSAVRPLTPQSSPPGKVRQEAWMNVLISRLPPSSFLAGVGPALNRDIPSVLSLRPTCSLYLFVINELTDFGGLVANFHFLKIMLIYLKDASRYDTQ